MEYLQRMNKALDYIENNIDGTIDYDQIGRIACCSTFYFQRMFAFITEVSLGEYIRRRRLTLAAFELQTSNTKVIDLALKYGYESPDSFTRAFQNLHGSTPTGVRHKECSVKAYPRITFNISIKGDVEMNYRIEENEAFRIIGVKRCYKSPEDNESVVGKLWNELNESGEIHLVNELSNGSPKGVHGFIEIVSTQEGMEGVNYTIASVSDKEAPEGMCGQIIPKATWAIFEITGSLHGAIEKTWKQIFTEWLPTASYEYVGPIDIECFSKGGNSQSEDYQFEVWISVVPK